MRDPRRLDRGVRAVGELVYQPTVHLRAIALITPVAVASAVTIEEPEGAAGTLSVLVLEIPHARWRVERETAGDIRADSSRRESTFLAREDDHAVGRARAVESSGIRSLEHRHRLDVLGVDIRNHAAVIATAPDAAAARGIRKRNSVQHEERLVAPRQRVLAANDDVDRAALRSRTRDPNAGHLALDLLHAVLL